VRARTPPALALAALLALPALAAAHATERGAVPPPGARLDRPPAVVRVALGAPVETAFLRLSVTGPGGRLASGPPRREAGDASAIRAPLLPGGQGRYRVMWRVLSQDGHVTEGAYGFGLGVRAPPLATQAIPDDGPLDVIARLLLIAGPLGLLGLVALRFGVVGPAWTSGGPRAPGAPSAEAVREATRGPLAAAMPRWWRCWWGLGAAWALGLALAPVALFRALGAGAGDLGTLVPHTRWGRAWLVEIAALVVALGATLVMARGPAARDPGAGLGWAIALGAPPAVAALAISWSGHASSGSDRTLGIAIDALHGWATAAWLGGLVGLAALVPAAVRRLAAPERVRLAAGIVVRFSGLAVAAVAVLVVTGVYRALAELSSLDDLVDTSYGQALLVKLILLTVLLMGGAYNRFVIHPRLERAALGLTPDDGGAAAALRVSVAAELVLALALMAAVAVLVSLPPP
jgi:copper transport protein